MSDPFDLERFAAAQAQVYARVVAELSAGRKRSHWMWFIFPQIEGLGFSTMAQRFDLPAALFQPELSIRVQTPHALFCVFGPPCESAILRGRLTPD